MNSNVKNNAIEVSYFENFQYVKDTDLLKIIQTIKDGYWRPHLDKIWECKAKSDPGWKKLKSQLPSFSISGTFYPSHGKENLKHYNSIVGLDIDKLPSRNTVEKLRKDINSDPHTLASFVSPSADGLKIFIQVDSDVEHHEAAHKQVAAHYWLKYHIEDFDLSTKDFSRLCFISSDKAAFINKDALLFHVDTSFEMIDETNNNNSASKYDSESLKSRFENVVQLTKRKITYYDGNRNNFIRLLAGNCNRWGIFEYDTLNLIINSDFCYDKREVARTIRSAYSKVAQFNSYPLNRAETSPIMPITDHKQHPLDKMVMALNAEEFDTLPFRHPANDDFDYLYPYLPDNIYDQLPDLLQQASNVFEDKRKRDIFFTAALGVLSGCFPNISGRYGNEEMFSNLYVFVTAPPGNGKSALRYAMDIALKYENLLESESSIDESKPRKMLFVPGNSSAAAVMVHLNENEGSGIFFETEADSLSNALKNEWGNYDDLLRKSFQHEPCSQSRRTENELIKVKQPKLSVVLSGTPDQVQSLTNSVKNGLFSRFLFYSFNRKSIWEDQSPSDNPKSYNEIFADFGNMFFDIIVNYRKYKAIKFKLTEKQWIILNEVQSGVLTAVSEDFDGEADSIIIRLGLIWFRIAMILTIIRSVANFDGESDLICDDIDFNLAKELIDVYKHHNLDVFESMPKQPRQHQDFKLLTFLNKLPNKKFKRDEAVNIAGKIGFSKRTADRMLPALISKSLLIKTEFGYYEKVIEK